MTQVSAHQFNPLAAQGSIMELFAQVDGRYSWQMFYDPSNGFYALNIHQLLDREDQDH